MQIEHCGLAGLLLIIIVRNIRSGKKCQKSVTSVGVMCHAAIFGESEASVKGMWITLWRQMLRINDGVEVIINAKKRNSLVGQILLIIVVIMMITMVTMERYAY